MSLLCAVTAFVGFMPTFWLPMTRGAYVVSPVLAIHGLLFSTWVLFFVLHQDHVGGYLAQRDAEEQNARAETIGAGRETQIFVHGERGKTDIHAIYVADDIEQRRKRNEPPRAFGENLLLTH